MIKYSICITLLAFTLADSISYNKNAAYVPIVKHGEERTADGSFAFYYESGDGSKRQEMGILKNSGTKEETLVMKGSWSYIDKNGKEVVVQYIADENGFRPQGTDISHSISEEANNAALHFA